MQSMLDHWEGGIRATGGALVQTKSYWYLIAWEWVKDSWRYHSIESAPGRLMLTIDGGHRVEIDRLEVTEAKETLGLWIAADGNQTKQFEALLGKIKAWADRIRSGLLSVVETWYSLSTGILKILDYPLAATSISYKDCSRLMTLLLQAALPKMGLPRTYAHALCYATKNLFGQGITDIWVDQGLQKLCACLRNGDSDDITGVQIRMSLQALMQELPTSVCTLTLPYATYGNLATSTWISHLWEFLDQQLIVLQHPFAPPPLQRQGDAFLLEMLSPLASPKHHSCNCSYTANG
jgi:hypothetical protein